MLIVGASFFAHAFTAVGVSTDGTVARSSPYIRWTVAMAVMDLRDVYPREIPGFHGRGGTLFVLSIVCVSIATVLVAVRVSTRFVTMHQLGKDDYFILLAMVMFTSHLIISPLFFFLTNSFKVFDIGLTIVNCVCKLVPEILDLLNASNKR